MIDMNKKYYISNKERFTQDFLTQLYTNKLTINGFDVYTNFPDRLQALLDYNRVNMDALLKEAKITSKKPYAAMQYQLFGYGQRFVVIAFLTEKFAYAYVYNINEPEWSEHGSIVLESVVNTAHLPF